MSSRTRSLGWFLASLALGALVFWLTRNPTRSAARAAPLEAPARSVLVPTATPERGAADTSGARDAAPLASISATAGSEAPSPEPKRARTRIVSGRVLDRGEHPIEGAEVFVGDPWDGEQLVARTAADGAFSGELRDDGARFDFTVYAAGFEGARRGLALAHGDELRLGTFHLGPGGEARGRVVDEAGQPLARAWVEWLPARVFPSDAQAAREDGLDEEDYDDSVFHGFTITGIDGGFRMRGLPPDECFLSASADGKSYGWTQVFTPRAELPEQEIVLFPTSTAASIVAGVVQDAVGTPLAGVDVRICTSERHYDLATTVEDGRFVLDYGWSAPVDLVAVDPKHRVGAARINDVAPGTRELVFRMGVLEWLPVRLVDGAQRPVLGGSLSLDDERIPADAEGVVRIERPKEPIELEVSAPGFRTKSFGPFEPAALGAELILTLEPARALRGHVLHDGQPVASARIALGATFAPGTVRESEDLAPADRPFLLTGLARLDGEDGTSDASGAFTLTIEPEGWLAVLVEVEGLPIAVFGPFDARASSGGDLVLELENAGALEGRVRTAPGSEPRERMLAACNGWNLAWTAPVLADGTYRIEGLPPGSYQVRPCVPPLASLQCLQLGRLTSEPVVSDCVVRAGQTTRFDLDLTREESVVLAGELVLVGAAPTRREAVLLAEDAAPHDYGNPRARAELDAEGRFELRLARPGTYRLVVDGGLLSVSETVQLFEGRTEWRRRFETGRLRLQVPAAARLQAEHAQLRYVAAETGTTRCASAELDAYWTIDAALDVPAGKGRFEVLVTGPRSEWKLLRELSISPGEEVVVEYP